MAGLACGVIGLPNVGKSTLFNALTRAGAKVENYPFCTIDPNVGIIEVPEPRLAQLNAVEQRSRAIPPIIEFVDIAGLVAGASRGEGRGNQFLEHIRHVDLLVHVVRAFADPNVAHVSADIDPRDDIRTINLELILADLQSAEQASERLGRKARGQDKEAARTLEVLQRVRQHLDQEQPVRTLRLSAEDRQAIRECRFLTLKPIMYLANMAESDLPNLESPLLDAVRAHASAEGSTVMALCAKVEAEIAELGDDPAERDLYLHELGIAEQGLSRLIRQCYEQLGLITFFTVGDQEVRGWTTRHDASAPEAGAVIHSDFHERFIRVEVIGFDDFLADGSRHAAREHGHMRIEGRTYTVQDGDILYFRIG